MCRCRGNYDTDHAGGDTLAEGCGTRGLLRHQHRFEPVPRRGCGVKPANLTPDPSPHGEGRTIKARWHFFNIAACFFVRLAVEVDFVAELARFSSGIVGEDDRARRTDNHPLALAVDARL